MPGCRTAIRVGCCALALSWTLGCGGAVERGDGADGGASQAGRASGRAGGSGAGAAPGGGSSGGTSAALGGETGAVDPTPVDTGCAAADLPPPDLACDAFSPDSCGPGLGCYPFVDHPQGSGCDQQRYGTVCLLAGQRQQGELCGDSDGQWCAPGFVCVVGQRAGKRCGALCKIGAPNTCGGGLICADLDVAGFGVCG